MKKSTRHERTKTFLSSSAEETKEFAGYFADELIKRNEEGCQGAFVLGLEGDLGSGKTIFVQGFARALGIEEKVLSPTFVIVKSYGLPNDKYQFQKLYHTDCYRLKNEQDIKELGWDSIVSDPKNIVLVEWPERIQKALPKSTVYFKFQTMNENTRKIVVID